MAEKEIKDSPAVNGVKNGNVLERRRSLHDNMYELQAEREQWGSKAEFLLSCIGLSVGIGNVWRFPYLAYKNGGGAFLLAYTIMLIIVGKPLFFAELAIGQFTGLGTTQVWKCFPVAKGIGISMIVMSVMVAIYYNVIMCYTLYYFGQSFRAVVPWAACFSWWGADDDCFVRDENTVSCAAVQKELINRYGENGSTLEDQINLIPPEVYSSEMLNCTNGTQTASEQFWERHVLELTPSIDNIGHLKWDLTLILFICWLLCATGLVKGIKTSGKIVYFTATFPYVILVILVIYGCTLHGAGEGLKYFFIPEWEKMLHIEIWRAAAEQLLFSLSLGWGCLIMFASYNKFDNTLYKDGLFVSILDFATSLMAGIVIFSVLGHLSVEMHVDISDVAKGGQGLAFVTYPEALARLPVPQLWSVLFFFMLFLLALDSEFSYLENVFTSIYDDYPKMMQWKFPMTFSLCFLFFLLGLPCVTQGGQYVLNLMDTYGGGYAGIFVATMETMVIMWGYGADRFADDIKFMLGFRPSSFWIICWKFLTPVIMLFVLVYSLWTHTPIDYAGIPYPMWAEYLGWCLIMVSVLQTPIWAIVQIIKYRKNLKQVFRPHPEWGPLNGEKRRQYKLLFAPDSANPDEGTGVDNLAMDPIAEDDSR